MLLMVEKGIRGGICHAIHRYENPNNKYMKDYDKNKESSYLKYWNVNSLYRWTLLQKLPVNKFELMEETCQFDEDLIKNYNEENDEGYFIEVCFHEPHNGLSFLPERKKIEKVENFVTELFDKMNMSFT